MRFLTSLGCSSAFAFQSLNRSDSFAYCPIELLRTFFLVFSTVFSLGLAFTGLLFSTEVLFLIFACFPTSLLTIFAVSLLLVLITFFASPFSTLDSLLTAFTASFSPCFPRNFTPFLATFTASPIGRTAANDNSASLLFFSAR